MYIYDKSSIHQDSIKITGTNISENVAQDILKPSLGRQYKSPVTLKIELTPNARITELHILMIAKNAQSVTFTTNNDKVFADNVVSVVPFI